MRKCFSLVIVLFFHLSMNAQTSCSGHEKDIKNGQIKKASSMGMTVNSITVKYIGKCQYRCISDIDDPGSAYSTPQKIKSTVIFKWEGNKYVFVRNEN